MFKGILPSSKRTASRNAAEEDIFAPRAIGKENRPGEHKPGSKQVVAGGLGHKPRDDIFLARRDRMLETVATNKAFERMLDDMQVSDDIRPKLVALESPVKQAMIRSSQFLTLNSTVPTTTTLRRTRSTESLDSPHKSFTDASDRSPSSGPRSAISPTSGSAIEFLKPSGSAPEGLTSSHTRAISLDIPRSTSQHGGPPAKGSKLIKEKEKSGSSLKLSAPEYLCQVMTHSSSLTMDLELVKKLRLCLRNEPAGWTDAFLLHGGYDALNARLRELLDVEWREEQHDDKCLHEVLRCFKALSTSVGGRKALQSYCPQPFIPLVALLYSDKKPGELGTRQLIVELLLILFEMYSSPPERNGQSSRAPSRSGLALPQGFSSVFALVREILLTERPDPAEQQHTPVAPHDFIESLHVPRIYKTYLQELSDLCRDYFWVFCHPNNTIWLLSQVDEARVEQPKAPGGMTGGVEYEAMQYLTSHFRLINACALATLELHLPPEHPHSAFKFHNDLHVSGMERIIAASRKASTAYYATLHLEIARYVALAARAGHEFSAPFMQLVGPPPEHLMKAAFRSGKQTLSPSKARVRDAPKIPTPRKAGALMFD